MEGAAERSEAGLVPFCGEAASSLFSLLGKEDSASGARVLSLTAHLRRISLLAFIPPEPYPLIRVELSYRVKGRHTPRANRKPYFYKENPFYDKNKRL